MKKTIKRYHYLFLYGYYSMTRKLFNDQNSLKKKLIFGALIVGLSSYISGCHKHVHKCYAPVFNDNYEKNDSIKP